ncbi:MAG: two-component system aerobic respiration control sensor histidine kinase ArcB [Psychromonas sp.]|uniref:aerobic respiration two-component sensor histidine kinase ArcB n=1 Tax=Psychromonas sp. TaxID=1884585 RepID=UPI0039E5FAEA
MSLFNLKTWVHYYVALLKRLGVVRFSLILAVAIISADSALQILIGMYFNEPLSTADALRSVLIGLLITPWAVYFLTVVVGDLEEARAHLDNTVATLKDMRQKDRIKTHELEKEIIERKTSQQKLVESAILLKSFLNTSPDLVFHRDLKSRFIICNKAMETLTGKTEKQLIGLTPFDLFPEDYAQQVVARDQTVKKHKKEQIHEYWLHFPNGQKAYFEVRTLPLFNSESVCTGIIGFGRDITERKKHQESIDKNIRDKTEFISTISHELRTPLNGIVGLSRMLLDEQLTSEQMKYLKTIHISAISLGNIFNDIINLDKLDRNRLNLITNKINMLDFIGDLKSLAFIQTEQKGLTLKFEQQEHFPDTVEADDTRLRQVLWNLISNAVKFTQTGTITMRCSCRPLNQNQVELCFEVEDQGVGIPKDQLDKIFAMYYQVEGNTFASGTGIGLAVSSKITKAMGGVISVKSKLGEGSTFKLTLAVNCPEEEHQEQHLQNNLPKLSILLVEDIELNILVTTSLLEKLGHKIDSAVNGAQALNMVAHHNYQLILMDIQLPDMDGYQITQKLREIHGNKLPPIVALTANVFADSKNFIDQGMDGALGKPLSVNPFNAIIQKLFVPSDKHQKTDFLLKTPMVEQTNSLFDQEMLLELMAFLPTSVILENVSLFEKLLPEYLDILDSNMVAKDQKGIVNEAHKIKGAAGSVGLKRIQGIAQQIQSPDLPAWWDNIDDWVALINSEFRSDITALKKWIVANGK